MVTWKQSCVSLVTLLFNMTHMKFLLSQKNTYRTIHSQYYIKTNVGPNSTLISLLTAVSHAIAQTHTCAGQYTNRTAKHTLLVSNYHTVCIFREAGVLFKFMAEINSSFASILAASTLAGYKDLLTTGQFG